MISVVIPLYNKEQSIERTIMSVLNQTYKDYELVVVNDGSTDRSLDVVERMKKSFEQERDKKVERMTVISQPNAGVSAARNRGVKEAKGEYVAFLDGDDLWEPIFLEEMVRLIEDFPEAAIYGAGLGYKYKGKLYAAPDTIPTNFRGVVENLWENYNTMMSWTSSSTICPRELALTTPADEQLTHGEDLDQWLRLMLQGDAVFYNKTLAYYVLDAENRAMHRIQPIEHHVVSVIERYAEARQKNAAFRKAFDTQMAYFLYEYMFTKDKAEAKRLSQLLDYSQLKCSLRFRMKCPYLYRIMHRMKG